MCGTARKPPAARCSLHAAPKRRGAGGCRLCCCLPQGRLLAHATPLPRQRRRCGSCPGRGVLLNAPGCAAPRRASARSVPRPASLRRCPCRAAAAARGPLAEQVAVCRASGGPMGAAHARDGLPLPAAGPSAQRTVWDRLLHAPRTLHCCVWCWKGLDGRDLGVLDGRCLRGKRDSPPRWLRAIRFAQHTPAVAV